MSVMTIAQLKRAVETGFVLDADAQSTHIENAAREVLRYGSIVRDREWEVIAGHGKGAHRVRIIHYLSHEWRHVMHNGNLVSLGYKIL